MRLKDQEAESGDGEEREEQRSEEGDDVGEGQGQEHLALDPLQGDDRDEGQGDDELAEDAGLAHFQDGLQDGGQFAGARSGLAQVALDVLHLDDGRVDDHADGDGQAAEGHEVGRQSGQAHGDEREQRGEGQGQDDDEGAPEAAQEEVEDQDDEQGADDERLGHRVDALGDDVGALVVGLDGQPGGQDAAGVDLGHALLDGPDDVPAVGPPQHHDDAADAFAQSVLHRAALADGLTDARLAHVADEDGDTALRFEDDVADILGRLE